MPKSFHRLRQTQQQQQGVALLTVLLLVVAITVVAGSMLASQKISIRQYELLLTQDKILQDIRAAEQMAAALIAADAKVNDSDSLQDVWAQPIAPVSLAEHSVALSISDASSKFNLNNLYHDGGADEQAVAVFERLLSQLDLDTNLAHTVLDWQDPDAEVYLQGGAESDVYSSTDFASGSGASSMANQPFVSVDELMSIKGFNPESVQKLQPYVAAVPYYLPINLNTADTLLLSALIKESTPEQFADFARERQNSPSNDLDALFKQPPWSMLPADELTKLKPMLDISSHGFRVLIDVSIKDGAETRHRYATSMISKIPSQSQSEPESSNQNQTGQPSAAERETEKALKIQAFGTRLWTYRPAF